MNIALATISETVRALARGVSGSTGTLGEADIVSKHSRPGRRGKRRSRMAGSSLPGGPRPAGALPREVTAHQGENAPKGRAERVRRGVLNG